MSGVFIVVTNECNLWFPIVHGTIFFLFSIQFFLQVNNYYSFLSAYSIECRFERIRNNLYCKTDTKCLGQRRRRFGARIISFGNKLLVKQFVACGFGGVKISPVIGYKHTSHFQINFRSSSVAIYKWAKVFRCLPWSYLKPDQSSSP